MNGFGLLLSTIIRPMLSCIVLRSILQIIFYTLQCLVAALSCASYFARYEIFFFSSVKLTFFCGWLSYLQDLGFCLFFTAFLSLIHLRLFEVILNTISGFLVLSFLLSEVYTPQFSSFDLVFLYFLISTNKKILFFCESHALNLDPVVENHPKVIQTAVGNIT